jgi:hypothetical protein
MIISLLTDYGTRDAYVGILKSVILEICPQAHLVDLTHEIGPGDIEAAAYLLQTAWSDLPSASVHLAVVDPGVGTARRAVAVQSGHTRFVAPDNGLLSYTLPELVQRPHELHAVVLDRPEHWRQPVSATFHGRDIFAPVAARLARGAELASVGSPVDPAELVALPAPRLERSANGSVVGQVMMADRFGNLRTNIDRDLVPAGQVFIELGRHRIHGLVETFGHVPAGEPAALIGSAGTLEVVLRNASASDRLGIQAGDTIVVRPA